MGALDFLYGSGPSADSQPGGTATMTPNNDFWSSYGKASSPPPPSAPATKAPLKPLTFTPSGSPAIADTTPHYFDMKPAKSGLSADENHVFRSGGIGGNVPEDIIQNGSKQQIAAVAAANMYRLAHKTMIGMNPTAPGQSTYNDFGNLNSLLNAGVSGGANATAESMQGIGSLIGLKGKLIDQPITPEQYYDQVAPFIRKNAPDGGLEFDSNMTRLGYHPNARVAGEVTEKLAEGYLEGFGLSKLVEGLPIMNELRQTSGGTVVASGLRHAAVTVGLDAAQTLESKGSLDQFSQRVAANPSILLLHMIPGGVASQVGVSALADALAGHYLSGMSWGESAANAGMMAAGNLGEAASIPDQLRAAEEMGWRNTFTSKWLKETDLGPDAARFVDDTLMNTIADKAQELTAYRKANPHDPVGFYKHFDSIDRELTKLFKEYKSRSEFGESRMIGRSGAMEEQNPGSAPEQPKTPDIERVQKEIENLQMEKTMHQVGNESTSVEQNPEYRNGVSFRQELNKLEALGAFKFAGKRVEDVGSEQGAMELLKSAAEHHPPTSQIAKRISSVLQLTKGSLQPQETNGEFDRGLTEGDTQTGKLSDLNRQIANKQIELKQLQIAAARPVTHGYAYKNMAKNTRAANDRGETVVPHDPNLAGGPVGPNDTSLLPAKPKVASPDDLSSRDIGAMKEGQKQVTPMPKEPGRRLDEIATQRKAHRQGITALKESMKYQTFADQKQTTKTIKLLEQKNTALEDEGKMLTAHMQQAAKAKQPFAMTDTQAKIHDLVEKIKSFVEGTSEEAVSPHDTAEQKRAMDVGAFAYPGFPNERFTRRGLQETHYNLIRAEIAISEAQKEVSKEMERLQKLTDVLPKGTGEKIGRFQDGKEKPGETLSTEEQKIFNERKSWNEWAAKELGIERPYENYFTHLWARGSNQPIPIELSIEIDKANLSNAEMANVQKWIKGNRDVPLSPEAYVLANKLKDYTNTTSPGFPDELAKAIDGKMPGSVFHQNLLERKGKEGYIQDAGLPQEQYLHTAIRKMMLDPVEADIKKKMENAPLSFQEYATAHLSGINQRPTKIENMLDTSAKQAGVTFLGDRPTKVILGFLRRQTNRAFLGLDVALLPKHLPMLAPIYADLGEKNFAIGVFDSVAQAKNGYADAVEHGLFGNTYDQSPTASKSTIAKFGRNYDAVAHAPMTFLFNRMRLIAFYGQLRTEMKTVDATDAKAVARAKMKAALYARKAIPLHSAASTPVMMQSSVMKTALQLHGLMAKEAEYMGENFTKRTGARSKTAYTFRLILGLAITILPLALELGIPWYQLVPGGGALPNSLTPPSVDPLAQIGSAALNLPDQYGAQSKENFAGRVLPAAAQAAGDYAGLPMGQAKKTIQGVQALAQGSVKTRSGKTAYKVKPSLFNTIVAPTLGPSHTTEGQQKYPTLSIGQTLKNIMSGAGKKKPGYTGKRIIPGYRSKK